MHWEVGKSHQTIDVRIPNETFATFSDPSIRDCARLQDLWIAQAMTPASASNFNAFTSILPQAMNGSAVSTVTQSSSGCAPLSYLSLLSRSSYWRLTHDRFLNYHQSVTSDCVFWLVGHWNHEGLLDSAVWRNQLRMTPVSTSGHLLEPRCCVGPILKSSCMSPAHAQLAFQKLSQWRVAHPRQSVTASRKSNGTKEWIKMLQEIQKTNQQQNTPNKKQDRQTIFPLLPLIQLQRNRSFARSLHQLVCLLCCSCRRLQQKSRKLDACLWWSNCKAGLGIAAFFKHLHLSWVSVRVKKPSPEARYFRKLKVFS